LVWRLSSLAQPRQFTLMMIAALIAVSGRGLGNTLLLEQASFASQPP
jgi:hypothetical protein